jgi:hypothetical protein
MNLSGFKYLALVLFVFSIFYLGTQLHISYEDEHASLNDQNLEPDLHLSNVRHFVRENAYERGVYHLEKAIESLREYESDIDLESGEKIEGVIDRLEGVQLELNKDSLNADDMSQAFSETLKALTLAELRVSEKYAESNAYDLSLVALKYAKLHLKNALSYADLPERKFELKVYAELDSLINSPEASPIELSMKIDQMIKEIDELIIE